MFSSQRRQWNKYMIGSPSRTLIAAVALVSIGALGGTSYSSAADQKTELTLTEFRSLVVAQRAVEKPRAKPERGGKRTDEGTEVRGSERADEVFLLEGTRPVGLNLQVENDVAFLRKPKDFIQRGNALAGKGFGRAGAEPRAGIERTHFLERPQVNQAMSGRGAVERGVMDGHDPRISRQVQVGLNETRAHIGGAAKCRHRIFRRVP